MFCIKIRYVWWVNYNNWYKILLILVVVIRVIIYRINLYLLVLNEIRIREKLKVKCWEKKFNDRRNNFEIVRFEMLCII